MSGQNEFADDMNIFQKASLILQTLVDEDVSRDVTKVALFIDCLRDLESVNEYVAWSVSLASGLLDGARYSAVKIAEIFNVPVQRVIVWLDYAAKYLVEKLGIQTTIKLYV